MSFSESRQRPYKVWSCDRQTRKSVVATSFRELKERGGDKLGYVATSELRVVLECDGTEIEDESYFSTVDRDTIFVLLRPGEKWLPPGVEALRAAITAIPRIVCDAINSMELIDKQPSWKIMDNKGRVTVVLHWDQRAGVRRPPDGREPVWRVEVVSQEVQTAAEQAAAKGQTPRAKLTLQGLGPRPQSRTLPRGGSREEKEEIPEVAVPGGGAVPKKSAKGHVRFMELAAHESKARGDESESDTENNANEEEQLSERYLLLVDQLSLEQNRHLTIKDIGVILERLSSKIVDVDRLEREAESIDIHNWTIKATIRGEVLREIGVIYNGQYYGIMEHPGYF